MSGLKYWIIIILILWGLPVIIEKSHKYNLKQYKDNCMQYGVRSVPQDFVNKFGNVDIPWLYLIKHNFRCDWYKIFTFKNCMQYGVSSVPQDYVDRSGNVNIPWLYIIEHSYKCKFYSEPLKSIGNPYEMFEDVIINF